MVLLSSRFRPGNSMPSQPPTRLPKTTCKLCKTDAKKNAKTNPVWTCKCCEYNYHINCLDLDEEYINCMKTLNKRNKKDQYECDSCVSGYLKLQEEVTALSAKVINIEKKLENTNAEVEDNKTEIAAVGERTTALEETIAKMQEKMSTMTTTVAGAPSTSGATEQSADKVLEEVENRKKRELNLVLHGVKEKKKDEQKQHDIETVKKVFNHILGEAPSDHLLGKLHRLGQYKENRTRPIKLCFKDKEARNKVLENANQLRTGTNEGLHVLSIKPDLSKLQRKQDSDLYKASLTKNLSRTEEQIQEKKAWRLKGPQGSRKMKLVQLTAEEEVTEEGKIIKKKEQGVKRQREPSGLSPEAHRTPRLSTAEDLQAGEEDIMEVTQTQEETDQQQEQDQQ